MHCSSPIAGNWWWKFTSSIIFHVAIAAHQLMQPTFHSAEPISSGRLFDCRYSHMPPFFECVIRGQLRVKTTIISWILNNYDMINTPFSLYYWRWKIVWFWGLGAAMMMTHSADTMANQASFGQTLLLFTVYNEYQVNNYPLLLFIFLAWFVASAILYLLNWSVVW